MCDCEPAQVYEHQKPKAQKQHICSDCNGIIQPGEIYNRIDFLADGFWEHHKVCLDCWDLWCAIDFEEGLDCYLIGGLRDLLVNVGWIFSSGEVWVPWIVKQEEPREGSTIPYEVITCQ